MPSFRTQGIGCIASNDVTVQYAEFVKTDVMKTEYTENGQKHTLCFHIRIGEILENT